MARTVVNFNAGPGALPREALELARDELLDFESTGLSIMEHSHRGKSYEAVHDETLGLLRELLAVPESHEILLMQGGASAMFALVPMNLAGETRSADYVVTGIWSEKALEEAQLVTGGRARAAGSGAENGAFVRIPRQDELELDAEAAYVHITSNNTIVGTQYHEFPDPGDVPVVADMSSDILSRPLEVGRFGLIYAGAQKNLGPSGVTVVVLAKSLLSRSPAQLPKIFRFSTHAQNRSLYHTPPTFGVYLMRNVLRWVRDRGGAVAMGVRNSAKAARLYAAIDESDGFYRCPAAQEARSLMNVVFRLRSETLEKTFASAAEEAGLVGLKGHRSVGGLRASLYNALSLEDVEQLVDFMTAFRSKA